MQRRRTRHILQLCQLNTLQHPIIEKNPKEGLHQIEKKRRTKRKLFEKDGPINYLKAYDNGDWDVLDRLHRTFNGKKFKTDEKENVSNISSQAWKLSPVSSEPQDIGFSSTLPTNSEPRPLQLSTVSSPTSKLSPISSGQQDTRFSSTTTSNFEPHHFQVSTTSLPASKLPPVSCDQQDMRFSSTPTANSEPQHFQVSTASLPASMLSPISSEQQDMRFSSTPTAYSEPQHFQVSTASLPASMLSPISSEQQDMRFSSTPTAYSEPQHFQVSTASLPASMLSPISSEQQDMRFSSTPTAYSEPQHFQVSTASLPASMLSPISSEQQDMRFSSTPTANAEPHRFQDSTEFASASMLSPICAEPLHTSLCPIPTSNSEPIISVENAILIEVPMDPDLAFYKNSLNEEFDSITTDLNHSLYQHSFDEASEQQDTRFSFTPTSNSESHQFQASTEFASASKSSPICAEPLHTSLCPIPTSNSEPIISVENAILIEVPMDPNQSYYKNSPSEEFVSSTMDLNPSLCQDSFDEEPDVQSNQVEKKRKRRYDRKHFCIFCENIVLNFRRHLLNNHSEETEVAEYKALLELSPLETKKQRKKMLAELSLKGDNIYNRKLLECDSSSIDVGKFLPVRRPPIDQSVKVTDFVFCTICNGSYLRKHFYQHAAECKRKKDDDDYNKDIEEESDKEEIISGNDKTMYLKQYSSPYHHLSDQITEKMKANVVNILRKDDIGNKALKDSLLCNLVSDFYMSHQAYKDRTQVTRKLRDGAKLLEKVQTLDSAISELRDIFHPEKLQTVMQACQSLCNIDDVHNAKRIIVGMNARLSWILEEGSKKLIEEIVCSKVLSDSVKEQKKRHVQDFQSCMRRQWKYKISTNTECMRRRYKIQKGISLPADNDIKIFSAMLKSMEKEYMKKVEQNLNEKNYEMLCKAVICHILTLNRRRPFEATHSELEFFVNRQKENCYSNDILESLAEEEKLALNELTSYTVPAKGTENIATILLTKQMEECISVIIKCREPLALNKSIYLFPKPGTGKPFDGSKVMRELRNICSGLKFKENMTATGLRKHVATVGHVQGPSFTSKLSQFMCHTESVHSKNYVAPLQVVHRGIIGNYLTRLEGMPEQNQINEKETPNKESTSYNETNSEPNYFSNENCNESTSHRENRKDPDYCYQISQDDDSENSEKKSTQPKKRTRKIWTTEEKKVLIQYFSEQIKRKLNPGTIKSREFIETHKNIFKDRTSGQINVYIDNINKGKIKIPQELLHLLRE